MPVMTIGDLFDAADEFERRLAHFYADLRDHSGDNNVRLLVYYLSRHRKHLSEVMVSCEPELEEEIRNTELPASVSFSPEKEFDLIAAPVADVKGGELLKAAINYDSSLLHLYNLIIEIPIFEKARGKFADLIETERRDISTLKKMQKMHYF